jgi:hypothetical protein
LTIVVVVAVVPPKTDFIRERVGELLRAYELPV